MHISTVLPRALLLSLSVAGVADCLAQTIAPLGEPIVLWEKATSDYAIFKIPTLATDRERKTLIAIAEGRVGSAADSATTHLVVRRSNDRGRTWSGTSVIHSDGKRTVGNPVPVLDRDTGTIWLFFCKDNREVWLTSTSDGGLTWKTALNLSSSLKRPEQTGFYATGPGHGIQLARGGKKGRLIVPAYGNQAAVGTNSHGSKSFVIFSDDHGKSWHTSEATRESITDGPDGNECMAAELSDGRIYLTIRNNLTRGGRAFAISDDSGSHWSPVQLDPALPEPVCQASLLSCELSSGRLIHLYVGPSVAATGRKDKSARRDLSLWASRDDCRHWEKRVLLWRGPSAYSDLAVLDDGTLCAAFEAGATRYDEKIVFATFRIEER